MAQQVGPAGRMQIGRALFALRDRAGLTQTQVAAAAGVSVGTVNRYEGWQDRSKLRIPTVRAIADACGATGEERDSLARLVASQESGWWLDHPALPAILSPLVSFEAYAEYEHVWATRLVPGLLQTPAYALQLHREAEPRTDDETIRATVDARLKRQKILTDRPPSLHLWVVMAESVLTNTVGGRSVMRDQLDHLATMAAEPGIDLQILPRGLGHVAGSGGHFVLLGRDDVGNPAASMAVVYLELHRQGLYLDAPAEVAGYKMMFDYLRSSAADTPTSKTLLARARQEYT
ncbi:helix-turn-helix domain-containing protein (plasmid) [Streptomyces albidoflavus]|nr:helix-turn-helix domain-containing protein [Streptomyces albidoflavus]WTD07634.1 helix-turn-helix domain-containing protein [Streptomyces albidoflavus]